MHFHYHLCVLLAVKFVFKMNFLSEFVEGSRKVYFFGKPRRNESI